MYPIEYRLSRVLDFLDDFSELFTFLSFLAEYQNEKKFLWSQLVTIENDGKQSYMDARKAAKFSSPKQLKNLTAQSSHWSIAKRFGQTVLKQSMIIPRTNSAHIQFRIQQNVAVFVITLCKQDKNGIRRILC